MRNLQGWAGAVKRRLGIPVLGVLDLLSLLVRRWGPTICQILGTEPMATILGLLLFQTVFVLEDGDSCVQ